MAEENNACIDSAATSYLRDKSDMLQCCHLIQRNNNKQTILPLTILCSASILSDVKLITAVFLLGYEQKPNTHPVKNLVFLAIFLVFEGVENRAHVFFYSGGGECFSTNDNDNFSLLYDTVVKQHGFCCAAIHVILSFWPQLPLYLPLLQARASFVVSKADDQNHASLMSQKKSWVSCD